jgi:hypothetical protein
MERWHRKDILADLANKYGFKSYLELGLRDAQDTFNHVPCQLKTSVDINPDCHPSFVGSTDDFFKQLKESDMWDLIFIDASHKAVQVYRDLFNSIRHLNDKGVIVLHDTLPREFKYTAQSDNGTAWKIIPYVLANNPELHVCTVAESTCGCGIVIKNLSGKRDVVPNPNMFYDYDYMDENRVKSQN